MAPLSVPERDAPAQQLRAAAEVRDDSVSDGERKTITALFADIKGSMEMLEDLDPEEARGIVDPALKLMIDAVRHYDGFVAQSLGDGIFALFGAPLAHEDHPQRALYAALRMQEAIKRYAEKLRAEHGVSLQVRVGVNTGEVVVRSVRKDADHSDYVPVGHSTGLAARMESLATPGTVLVSEHTHKLTEGYFQFRAMGEARVKGVSEPLRIYEVTGLGPLRTRLQAAARRGLTKFVGRQHEIDAMKRALEQARAGHGQIVAAIGEAGLGKSRLFHEFKAITQDGAMVLETFSVSHSKATAYLPIIDLLKNYFKIASDDDDRQRREKLGGRVLMLDRTLEDTLPYMLALLGLSEANNPLAQMDQQIRRRRTLDAIKRLLLRESLSQPLILIFEDLHWLDPESQALLDLLADSIGTARILMLVNYRPEYRHQWGAKSYYTQLRLDPLGNESAGELLTALLGNEQDLSALRKLIVEKTEGNPFFMEEIVQALFDQSILTRNGKVALTRPTTEIRIPPTVQGVLASRIDQLEAGEKELLQTLAVIGKEFPAGLIKRIVPHSEDELERLLSRLQLGEFIYERPAFPDVEYTFKHALTLEVAYNSVLIERRRALHARVAQAQEALYSGHPDEHHGQIAEHYRLAGRALEAIKFLRLAALAAMRRSNYGEAVDRLNSAIGLLEGLPDRAQFERDEMWVYVMLGAALMAAKGFSASELGQAYAHARELCTKVGDDVATFAVLSGLWGFHYTRAELKETRQIADESMALALKLNDPGLMRDAHRTLGSSLAQVSEYSTAREHLERALAIPGGDRPVMGFAMGPDANVLCLTVLSDVLEISGYPDQALARARQALKAVDQRSDPFSFAMALSFTSQVHCRRGEWRRGTELAGELLAICSEWGFPFWTAVAHNLMAWGLVEQGRLDEAREHIEPGMRHLREGADFPRIEILITVARLLDRSGRTDEGLQRLDEYVEMLAKIGLKPREIHFFQVRGEMLRRLGREAEAEKELRQALELATATGARSPQLRATVSIARLLASDGRRKEAHEMLAAIYGWFTEGLDTPDLIGAKALLEELASDTET